MRDLKLERLECKDLVFALNTTPLLRGGATENELIDQINKANGRKDYKAAHVAIDQLLSMNSGNKAYQDAKIQIYRNLLIEAYNAKEFESVLILCDEAEEVMKQYANFQEQGFVEELRNSALCSIQYNHGIEKAGKQKYRKSLTSFEKALKLCPSNMKAFKDSIVSNIKTVMNNLAVTKEEEGDNREARKLFKQISRFSMENDDGTANTTDFNEMNIKRHNQCAMSYFKEERYADCLREAQKALEIEPNN